MNAVFALMKFLAWTATIAVMFGGALRLGPSSLRLVRERPMLFLRTLGAVAVVVPVVSIIVVLALDVRGLAATTLLLMAICPGMPLLLAATRSVEGAAGTAFVALLLTATIEPLLIPAWSRLLRFVHPGDLAIEPRYVLAVLVPTVFIPVAAGFALRRLAPRVAFTLARLCGAVAAVGIAMDVVVVLIQGAPILRHVPVRAYGAVVLVTLADALLGYWAGWPDREDQKAIAMVTALGNPALALAVIVQAFPDAQGAALVAAYLLVRSITLVPFEWWLRRLRRRRTLDHPVTP
jgi:BASS family bile acid:Na+ symporter